MDETKTNIKEEAPRAEYGRPDTGNASRDTSSPFLRCTLNTTDITQQFETLHKVDATYKKERKVKASNN